MNLEDDFYNEKRSNFLPFVINDAVKVVSGKYTGGTGSIISYEMPIEKLNFIVELSDGKDIKINSQFIEKMDV